MTPRQTEVFQEVCKGKCNKEIARTMGISDATVKLHMTEILRKQGVRTRGELIARFAHLAPEEVAAFTPVTDEDILREFVDTTFKTLGDGWPERVLRFGRCVIKRAGE